MDTLIRQKLLPMGLYNAVHGLPGVTIIGKTSHRGKQPDYGWGPKRPPHQSRPAEPKKPSVALEVAYIESDEKLNLDVRYWLSPTDGNVKMCLTIRLDRANKEFRMESWIRQGAEDNNERIRIRRNQVVFARVTPKNRPIVTGNLPFRIPFETLMLRPMDTGMAAEQDLLFLTVDLEQVVESVWDS